MSGIRKPARPTRPQATRATQNTPVLRGSVFTPPPPPPPPMPRSCRVHGTRYEGCPLDMIDAERADSGSSFWEAVGWIAALLFLASVFGIL
jgi:hypothetical protein